MKQLCWISALVLLVWAPQGFSQENMQKALARAQYMLKQMSAEKASLQSQNDTLQSQIKDLNAELEKTKNKAKKDKDKLKNNISSWKTEYEKLKNRFIEISTALRDMTDEKESYVEKFQKQTQNFDLCYKDNEALVGINNKLLQKFEGKGVWGALVQKEPVTGLGKVEMENLVQKYKHKIEDVNLGMNTYQIHNVDQ